MDDPRRSHPSTQRNRDPILQVLRRVIPPDASVLEIASGTGEHAWYFCTNLPGITWQPTEGDSDNLESIEAWRMHGPAPPNMRPPFVLDATHPKWGVGTFDASLRARDPSWGVRDVEALTEQAEANDLVLHERIAMPVNNFVLVFRRT